MNMKRGFTLIEMLVVLAIVSILAAVAYPELHRPCRAHQAHRRTDRPDRCDAAAGALPPAAQHLCRILFRQRRRGGSRASPGGRARAPPSAITSWRRTPVRAATSPIASRYAPSRAPRKSTRFRDPGMRRLTLDSVGVHAAEGSRGVAGPDAPLTTAEQRRRGGFSLIELLAVLAIAAILLAVAAPDLRQLWSAPSSSRPPPATCSPPSAWRAPRRWRAASSSPDAEGIGRADWRRGWTVFLDRDGDRQPGPATPSWPSTARWRRG
jgi:prepilin-type N-terminal cleavage/methylation domain-containing protein